MIQTRKKYSREFKAQAVELAQAGRPVPELAADLEVSSNLIYSWVRKAEGAQQPSCAWNAPSKLIHVQ